MPWSEPFDTTSAYLKYKIGVEKVSTDIFSRNVTVSVKVNAYITNDTIYSPSPKGSVHLVVNNQIYDIVYYNKTIDSNEITLAERRIVIGANTIGDANITVQASFHHTDAHYSAVHTYSTSFRIPMPSRVRVPNMVFGTTNNVIVSITRDDPSFTHRLKFRFVGDSSSSSTTLANNVGSSYTWIIDPDVFCNKIPNDLKGTWEMICETFQGTKMVGYTKTNFTYTINKGDTALIGSSWLFSDSTGAYESAGIMYLRRSNITMTMSIIEVNHGATLKSVVTTIGSQTINGYIARLGVLNFTMAELINAKTVFTNSRGEVTEVHPFAGAPLMNYAQPTTEILTGVRCNQNGTANEEGAYIKFSFKGHTIQGGALTASYRKSGSSAWTDVSVGVTTINSSTIFAADTESSYEIRLAMTDFFNTTAVTKVAIVPAAFTLVDYRTTGHGLAFGKVSEKDNFDCNLDAYFRKKVQTALGSDLDLALQYKGLAYSKSNDFDNITDSGIYYIKNETFTHGPSNTISWSYMIVLHFESLISQVIFRPVSGITMREHSGGTWHAWKTLS